MKEQDEPFSCPGRKIFHLPNMQDVWMRHYWAPVWKSKLERTGNPATVLSYLMRPNLWKLNVRNVWHWRWQPRVCSFCNSVNPHDLFLLLEEGWQQMLSPQPMTFFYPPAQPPSARINFGSFVLPQWYPQPVVSLTSFHITPEVHHMLEIFFKAKAGDAGAIIKLEARRQAKFHVKTTHSG